MYIILHSVYLSLIASEYLRVLRSTNFPFLDKFNFLPVLFFHDTLHFSVPASRNPVQQQRSCLVRSHLTGDLGKVAKVQHVFEICCPLLRKNLYVSSFFFFSVAVKARDPREGKSLHQPKVMRHSCFVITTSL